MNISENIRYILDRPEKWQLFTNRSYRALVQRSDPEKVYNVPGRPGIVYNFFEDSYAKVTGDGFVITGIAGEMWPVGAGTIVKYDIAPEAVTYEPQEVSTVELPTVYAGILIPAGNEFALETDYGERVWLKGNRPDIGHGGGDWILVQAIEKDGAYLPDLSDCGRIVNGTIFEKLYKPF